ncbi:MAG TPA: YkvA family protein [Pyrinomonadaceae bacterium]
MRRIEAKRRMKNLLLFLPNMISLCGRLMTDRRVPRVEKALFAGAIVYAVMPLDFIPDMIPFVGQIDDAYLIALALLRLLNRTERDVVREHWRGGGDIIQLAEAVADVAPLLLPQSVRRVLSAKIEVAPEAEESMLAAAAARSNVLLVEAPEEKRARGING